MSRKYSETDAPTAALKDEFARQRWELFHRAIAHAKRSTSDALADGEQVASESAKPGPRLSIVR